MKDTPLSCRIEGDELVIRIGIDVLADACEQREPFWVYDEDLGDMVQAWKVVDNLGWARDVSNELNREKEDGSSPLTNLLDAAFVSALDDGSLSVWGPELEIDDPEAA